VFVLIVKPILIDFCLLECFAHFGDSFHVLISVQELGNGFLPIAAGCFVSQPLTERAKMFAVAHRSMGFRC